MRKVLYFIVAAIAAVSCTVQEPDSIDDIRHSGEGFVEKTFSASTLAPQTKVILSEKDSLTGIRPILWSPGDSISVFDVNPSPKQDAVLHNCSDTTCASTTFSGLVAPSTTGYYAIYPGQKVSTDDKEGLISYNEAETIHLAWAGYNQAATAFGFDPEKVLMMAYTGSDSDNFDFKHVFAFVKVKTTFDCETIEISGNNGEKLGCQDVWLQMKDGVPTIVNTTTNKCGVTSVTLRAKSFSGKQYVPAGTYLVAVIPQTLSNGFTLTFKPTEMSGSVTKSTSKSVELTRGSILNLGTFSKDDFSGFPSTGEWEGKGTEDEPYLITTAAQWNLLAERLNGKAATYRNYKDKYYRLANDIDFGGETAGCAGDELERAFEGVFDGYGHTISNYYPSTGDGVEALFGYAKSAVIKNLTVKPAGFHCRYSGFCDFTYSPLIGVSASESLKNDVPCRIINCHAESLDGGTLTLKCHEMDCFYGSIVGWIRADLYIMSCSNSVNVCLQSTPESSDICCVGGIAGVIDDYYSTMAICRFDRCRNTGLLQAESYGEGMAGGILGYDNDTFNGNALLRVSNCENTGDIKVLGKGYENDEEQYAGGFVGKHDSDGAWLTSTPDDPFFYNCLNAGHVYISTQCGSSAAKCGGFAGYCYDDDTEFYNCVSLWNPTEDALICSPGAFTGYPFHGDFHYCYTYADLEDENDFNANRQNIPEHPDESVVFAGYDDNKTFQYCYWNGKLSDRSLRLSF